MLSNSCIEITASTASLHHLSEEQISFSKLFGSVVLFLIRGEPSLLISSIDKAAVYPLELSLPTYCISLSLLFSRVPSILSNILFNPSHHYLNKSLPSCYSVQASVGSLEDGW